MAPPLVALLDANVLYPAPLRDLLLSVAEDAFFQPRWSEAIHDEWTRNVLSDRSDLSAEQIARTRRLMDTAFEDALVTGYERLLSTLTNDPKDRHVLAAAILGKATVIVTFNLRDFPASALAPHGIEALHPDTFLLRLYQGRL